MTVGRYGMISRIERVFWRLPLILMVLPIAFANAQQFPVESLSAVEPIRLTLTAPGDGKVIELLQSDHMTGFTRNDPATGLTEIYHPFSAARVLVTAVEQQIANDESQLHTIESALETAGYFYADLDKNYFALNALPSSKYAPVEKAARSAISQDESLAEDIFNANLIDPWGTNDVNPMRLSALVESARLSRALALTRRLLGGRAIATDAEIALELATASLRVRRSRLGLEKIRVRQSSNDVEPRIPNSEKLLIGSTIGLQVAFNEGLQNCEELASYWRNVESNALWTAADATFARRLTGDDWPTNAKLPYVTRYGETIPLIGDEIEEECDKAHEEFARLKAMRSIAVHSVALIDVEAGLFYEEQYYPRLLPDAVKFDLGMKRNEQRFALELDPTRLVEHARQSGVDEGVVSVADAQVIRHNLLDHLEELKWDSFKFRGNQRRLSKFEVETLTTALSKQTVASVGVLRFRGKLLSVDEMPPAVFPLDLAPNGYERTNSNLSDYDRAFQAIDSRLGYSLLRLDDRSRPIDMRIAALSDAAALALEARTEKERLATTMHFEWKRIALRLEDIKTEYDFGRIWVKEPIRTISTVAREKDMVTVGQPLLIAEATSRFRVTVESASDAGVRLGSLPVGTRFRIKFSSTGLPPLSHEARRKILSSSSPRLSRAHLSKIYERIMQGVGANATTVAQTDNGATLELKIADVPDTFSVTVGEGVMLSDLGFLCRPGDSVDTSLCAFPLGPIGADSKVAMSIEVADPVQAEQAEIDFSWRRMVAQ
ncbi:hypothetical protein [Microvirga sesbaniae]|uniref:hypothetical protein n=1 Tax=Microvirga sesbaniae TaxID=681392 RepID=UPI0021C71663|nr:hypothetical protein [Microvirga sp. HBU67692]